MNYYNENDPKAAAWLRSLIAENLIPHGHVDTRSIADVSPADLQGFCQAHFFAGIAGWPLALALAGWPEDAPVWTGSCPCQPFSQAGKRRGTADERHLWPVFAALIRQCRPPVVFGEQVASADGRAWLAGVFADVEDMGYAAAGADLCAAGIGAPHIRQRLYWVAAAGHEQTRRSSGTGEAQGRGARGELAGCGETNRLAHPGRECDERRGGTGNMAGEGGDLQGKPRERERSRDAVGHSEPVGGLVLPDSDGCRPGSSPAAPAGHGDSPDATSLRAGGLGQSPGDDRQMQRESGAQHRRAGETGGPSAWTPALLIPCRDGKTRCIPAEPAFFPLAHGVSPARVVALRGAGNAIVPQVAAEFIGAWLDISTGRAAA